MIEKQSNISYRGGAREGAGRPKGSLDKGNAVLREMILEALEGAGGVAYLIDKAETHPQSLQMMAQVSHTPMQPGN